MSIRIDNETTERIPRQHVLARIAQALGAFDAGGVMARVTFSDVNGPKGGRDTRCALLVTVPGQPPIRVERVESTARLAFDEGYAVLLRRLGERRTRRRDASRHPKKYFTAKRWL